MENDLSLNFDNNNRITKWPKKNSDKLLVLKFLYSKFEQNKKYNEKEVNFIINQNIAFEGAVMLRRALIDQGFMTRTIDGREYSLLPNGDKISTYQVNG